LTSVGTTSTNTSANTRMTDSVMTMTADMRLSPSRCSLSATGSRKYAIAPPRMKGRITLPRNHMARTKTTTAMPQYFACCLTGNAIAALLSVARYLTRARAGIKRAPRESRRSSLVWRGARP
jgi:hypothetical protein